MASIGTNANAVPRADQRRRRPRPGRSAPAHRPARTASRPTGSSGRADQRARRTGLADARRRAPVAADRRPAVTPAPTSSEPAPRAGTARSTTTMVSPTASARGHRREQRSAGRPSGSASPRIRVGRRPAPSRRTRARPPMTSAVEQVAGAAAPGSPAAPGSRSSAGAAAPACRRADAEPRRAGAPAPIARGLAPVDEQRGDDPGQRRRGARSARRRRRAAGGPGAAAPAAGGAGRASSATAGDGDQRARAARPAPRPDGECTAYTVPDPSRARGAPRVRTDCRDGTTRSRAWTPGRSPAATVPHWRHA